MWITLAVVAVVMGGLAAAREAEILTFPPFAAVLGRAFCYAPFKKEDTAV